MARKGRRFRKNGNNTKVVLGDALEKEPTKLLFLKQIQRLYFYGITLKEFPFQVFQKKFYFLLLEFFRIVLSSQDFFGKLIPPFLSQYNTEVNSQDSLVLLYHHVFCFLISEITLVEQFPHYLYLNLGLLFVFFYLCPLSICIFKPFSFSQSVVHL